MVGSLLVSQGSLGLIGFPGVARPTAFTEILFIAEIWEIYPSIAILIILALAHSAKRHPTKDSESRK